MYSYLCAYMSSLDDIWYLFCACRSAIIFIFVLQPYYSKTEDTNDHSRVAWMRPLFVYDGAVKREIFASAWNWNHSHTEISHLISIFCVRLYHPGLTWYKLTLLPKMLFFCSTKVCVGCFMLLATSGLPYLHTYSDVCGSPNLEICGSIKV